MEDKEIIELYFARDEKAIQCTAEVYGERLRRLAYNIVQDDRDAQECENETYFRTWRSIPPKNPRKYFLAFLSKITRNLALDKCRQQNADKRNAIVIALSEEMEQCIPAGESIEEKIYKAELEKCINGFIERQTEVNRNLFLRRYWYMDSIAELSERFAMSESKVKNILFRLRKDLRLFLRKEGYDI